MRLHGAGVFCIYKAQLNTTFDQRLQMQISFIANTGTTLLLSIVPVWINEINWSALQKQRKKDTW